MFPVGVIIPAHVSLEFIGAVYQAGALKMVDVYPVVSSARFEDCYNSSQSVDILRIQVAIGEGFAGEGDELAVGVVLVGFFYKMRRGIGRSTNSDLSKLEVAKGGEDFLRQSFVLAYLRRTRGSPPGWTIMIKCLTVRLTCAETYSNVCIGIN